MDRPLVCDLIREAREKAGLSQFQMAVKLEMSEGGYSAYELRREPSPERRREIAKALELPEDAFELGLTKPQANLLAQRLEDAAGAIEKAAGHLSEVARRLSEGK